MMVSTKRWITLTVLTSLIACTQDHASGEMRSDGKVMEIQVSPSAITLNVADGVQSNPGTQQFRATFAGAAGPDITWAICPDDQCFAPDEWNQYGSITANGFFTAPLVLPNPSTFRVRATSTVDPEKVADAVVTIDRSVEWRVTTDHSIDSAGPSWRDMQSAGDHEVYYHILHDGREEICRPAPGQLDIGPCYRQVIFHVGTGYRPGNGAVFFFHGAGGNISNCSGWKAENDRHGWITVCIQGVSSKSSRSWNVYWAARKGKPAAQTISPDDSALAWAIAEDLVTHLGVSPRRIHATGHSAGDLMLARLAAENGAQIASIAQVTGNMYGTDHEVCFGDSGPCNPPSRFPQVHEFPPFGYGIPNLNYPLSVLIIMGTADQYTPVCGKHNNSPNIDEDFKIYADSFNCTERGPNDNPFCPFVPGQSARCQQSKFLPESGRACEPSAEVYKYAMNCDQGVAVRAYSLLNGEHRWESTDVSDLSNPIHNSRFRVDFPAATPPENSGSQYAVVWDFFNRHPKP